MGIGLPPVRFHDLRASWATTLFGLGIEPAKVMVAGGWSDIFSEARTCRTTGLNLLVNLQTLSKLARTHAQLARDKIELENRAPRPT